MKTIVVRRHKISDVVLKIPVARDDFRKKFYYRILTQIMSPIFTP